MKQIGQKQGREFWMKTSKSNQSEVIKMVNHNNRRRQNVGFFALVCLVAMAIIISCPATAVAKVFEPPYDNCSCWGQRVGGADDERHSCNRYSGGIGTYAAAWVGGATAEAHQIIHFYVGTQKTINVDAEILRTGGAATVGLGAFAGTEKTWWIDDNYYREEVDHWWQWDDIIVKIINMISLVTGIQCQTIQEAIEAISIIANFYELYSALNALAAAGDANLLHINFSFNAQPGSHTVKVGLRSNAAACITGSAFAVSAGQVTSVTVSGIDPPNRPTVYGPEVGSSGASYDFTAVTTDPNVDRICYRFDWGDDSGISDWSQYVQSGENLIAPHTYSEVGTYCVKVQAKDIDEMTSGWSECFEITIDEPQTAAEIELSPSSCWFGRVKKGNCSSKRGFQLTSVGTETASGTVSLKGENPGQFRITQGGGPFSLDPGDTLEIEVKFCPTSFGPKSATLYAAGSNCSNASSSLGGWGAIFDGNFIVVADAVTQQSQQNNQGNQSNPCSLGAVPAFTEEAQADQSTEVSPESPLLLRCYPNPFNPETEISYTLPSDCHVKLSIYNLLGQRIKSLVDAYQGAGHRTVHWNGTDENGNAVSSGVYFYRLKAGELAESRKMILMR